MFISLHLCNSSKQTCKHKSKSFSWNKHLRDFVWHWIRLNIPFCSWQNCAGFQGLSCSISTQFLRHSIGHALVAKALPLVNVEPSERHESIRGPTGTKKSCQTIQRPNKMFKVPFSTNLRMAAEGVRVPYPNQKIHSTTTNDLIVFFFVNCHPPMLCVFQFVPMPTGSKQQYRKYEWCYQTRHTHHAGGMSTNEDLQTDQCLMNLKHSPSSWQRG